MASEFQDGAASASPARAGLWALRAGAVAFVLLATLRPGSPSATSRSMACVFCGDIATAEVLQNLFLFLPFGLAFALGGAPVRRVVLAGALFSAAVELGQYLLPGRDPSPDDLLVNSIGTLGGAWLARTAPRWLDPPPRLAPWLSLAAAAGAALVWAGTAFLLHPVSPAPAALADTAVLGSPASGRPPLTSVVDAWRRRLVVVEARGDDLALWVRTRAADLRLDQPDLRVRDALRGVAPGDTIPIALARRSDGYCLGRGTAQRCGLRYGVAQGWALVLYPESAPEWLRRLLGVAWLAGLAFPVGLWFRRGPVSLAALVVCVGGFAAGPALLGMGAPRAEDLGAAVAGLVLGRGLGRPLYSTVTLLARLRGRSTSHPRSRAM